jgi:hypothetical protein
MRGDLSLIPFKKTLIVGWAVYFAAVISLFLFPKQLGRHAGITVLPILTFCLSSRRWDIALRRFIRGS